MKTDRSVIKEQLKARLKNLKNELNGYIKLNDEIKRDWESKSALYDLTIQLIWFTRYSDDSSIAVNLLSDKHALGQSPFKKTLKRRRAACESLL